MLKLHRADTSLTKFMSGDNKSLCLITIFPDLMYLTQIILYVELSTFNTIISATSSIILTSTKYILQTFEDDRRNSADFVLSL